MNDKSSPDFMDLNDWKVSSFFALRPPSFFPIRFSSHLSVFWLVLWSALPRGFAGLCQTFPSPWTRSLSSHQNDYDMMDR